MNPTLFSLDPRSPEAHPVLVDVHSPAVRSANMRAIRSRGTKPERAVQAVLCRLGARFERNPPGLPDIVLPGKKGIFVNGCFWHGHGCEREHPAWKEKIERTRERDRATISRLASERQPWRLLVIWECETWDFDALRSRILDFLGS